MAAAFLLSSPAPPGTAAGAAPAPLLPQPTRAAWADVAGERNSPAPPIRSVSGSCTPPLTETGSTPEGAYRSAGDAYRHRHIVGVEDFAEEAASAYRASESWPSSAE